MNANAASVGPFASRNSSFFLLASSTLVSIDNMQIINRCKHPKAVKKGKGFDFRLVRLAVKAKVPHAYHHLISSFFYPFRVYGADDDSEENNVTSPAAVFP